MEDYDRMQKLNTIWREEGESWIKFVGRIWDKITFWDEEDEPLPNDDVVERAIKALNDMRERVGL